MASSRTGAVAGLVLVALLLGGAAGAAGTGGGPATVDQEGGTGALVALQLVPETDNTVTRIAVHANGSATWELRIRTRLDTDAAAAEYRSFQERFRANETRFVGEFQRSVTGIVANARSVTGREMAVSGVRADTTVQTVPRRWGVVAYEFRWDGFAAVEGDRLVVGDVFEGGLFIAEGDALEVVGPAGYRVESADPAPDESGNATVGWLGREDFADGRPRVVFAPAGGDGDAGVPTSAIAAGVVLLGALAVVAVGVRRWRRPGGSTVERSGPPAGGAAASAPDEAPLLADEDHVRRALADRGGRMRQAELADALDWSRSKTSRVLQRMDEAGTIRKLRLGRENVIDLVEDGDGGA